MEPAPTPADTAAMRHDTQAFNWDREAADDRPSEFRTSTSYALLHAEDDGQPRQSRGPSRRHHRSGSSSAWRLLTLVLLAGSAAIFVFASHVRG